MGYTTVRDAGGLDAGFKLAVEQGLIPGPRLVLALQIISPTGGIGDRVSPSGHDCCGAYDPLLPPCVANGSDAVRDVVRTMVRAGADVIKTATTGGASSRPGHGPLDAAFSLAEMEALVTESHALGRRVMCHALGGPGLRTALTAGVDSIEHGCYLDEDATLLGADGGPGHLLRADPHGVRLPPREPGPARAGPRGRAPRAPRGERARGRSSWACRSRRAPTRAGTGTRRTRSSSSTWSRPGSARCRRSARPPSGPPRASGSSARSAPSRRGRLADLVLVGGNPLDDVTLLLDPARIELVLQGRRGLRGPARPASPLAGGGARVRASSARVLSSRHRASPHDAPRGGVIMRKPTAIRSLSCSAWPRSSRLPSPPPRRTRSGWARSCPSPGSAPTSGRR